MEDKYRKIVIMSLKNLPGTAARKAYLVLSGKLLTAKRAAKIPGATETLQELEALSKKAGIPTPKLYVGYSFLIALPEEVVGENTIIVPYSFFALDSRIRRADLAHELGHIVNK